MMLLLMMMMMLHQLRHGRQDNPATNHVCRRMLSKQQFGTACLQGSYKLPHFAHKVLRSQSPVQLQLFFAHMSDSGSGGGSGSNAASPSNVNLEESASENN
jgi:hypothetical protein